MATATPIATELMVATDISYTNLLKHYNGTYVTQLPTVAGELTKGVQLYSKMRHEDQNAGWTPWSTDVTFQIAQYHNWLGTITCNPAVSAYPGFTNVLVRDGEYIYFVGVFSSSSVNSSYPGIVKAKNDGTIVWVKYISPFFGHNIPSVAAVDSLGNLVIGYQLSTGSIPPSGAMAVLKLSAAGDIVWCKSYTLSSYVIAPSVLRFDTSGQILISAMIFTTGVNIWGMYRINPNDGSAYLCQLSTSSGVTGWYMGTNSIPGNSVSYFGNISATTQYSTFAIAKTTLSSTSISASTVKNSEHVYSLDTSFLQSAGGFDVKYIDEITRTGVGTISDSTIGKNYIFIFRLATDNTLQWAYRFDPITAANSTVSSDGTNLYISISPYTSTSVLLVKLTPSDTGPNIQWTRVINGTSYITNIILGTDNDLLFGISGTTFMFMGINGGDLGIIPNYTTIDIEIPAIAPTLTPIAGSSSVGTYLPSSLSFTGPYGANQTITFYGTPTAAISRFDY